MKLFTHGNVYRRKSIIVLIAAAIIAIAVGSAIAGNGNEPSFPSAQKKAAWENDHQITPPPNAAPPAAKDPNRAPPVDPPPPPAHDAQVVNADPSSGIQVPVSPAQFTPTTAWVAQRNNQFVHVYAGSDAHNAQQGELVVWIVGVDNGADIVARVPFGTPSPIGALTLTQVSGDVVSFTSPGHQGTFNLTTHQFNIS